MSANASDLRAFYGEVLGPTQEITAASGAATPLDTALPPGRYVLRITDYGGATGVWVRQGAFGSVPDAVAAAPNTLFVGSTDAVVLNAPLASFMVHGSNLQNPAQDDGFSFFSVGGAATVQVTKIGRT